MTDTIIHQPETEIDTTTVTDLFPYEETDDPNKRTHIVRPMENDHLGLAPMSTGQDVVDTARLLGAEITALCGFKFIPKHNPEKFDACYSCITVAQTILNGGM